VIILIYVFRFLPESVRWLLARGRKDEAREILEKVAKENKVHISEDVYESLAEEPVAKSGVSVLDLFRYKRLGVRSLNIFFNWFVNSGVYYGLSLNTSNLGGNGINLKLCIISNMFVNLPSENTCVFVIFRLLELCNRWSS